MKALGEAATDLPWLSPCADSLVALARNPTAAAWPQVRFDPGCVLLLFRQTADPSAANQAIFSTVRFRESSLLETARKLLSHPGFVDWNRPEVFPVYRACLSQAKLARTLAQYVPGCDADCAWCGALVAPLGWLAVSAAHPDQADACLHDPTFAQSPSAV